jgi:serine/threonine protein kinase
MAPEHVDHSRDVDARADLWSLGCVLYATLTGSAPHERLDSVGHVLLALCSSPPRHLRDAAPWVSPAVADFVHGALEIDPGARYPSAAAMLEALRAILPDGGLAADDLVGSGHEPRPVHVQVPIVYEPPATRASSGASRSTCTRARRASSRGSTAP